MSFTCKALALLAVLATSGLGPSAAAHPNEDLDTEGTGKRDLFMRSQTHLRKQCASQFEVRGHESRAAERRKALVDRIRNERGIASNAPYRSKRDLTSVLATDHNETDVDPDIGISTPADDVFGDDTSCILWPDIDPLGEGPYYVRGEYVRNSAIEDLIGVNMTIDVQVIDINTCNPVVSEYVEFWQANQTGVYSGTNNTDNGNTADLTNLNNTWLRGVWPTDDEGVVQMETLFPGHYAPRATHTHIMVHQNATVLTNGTLELNSGTVSHVGQIFFDQDLIDEADTVYPYTLNPYAIKLNSDDGTLATEAASVDPIAWYVYVGDTLAEGIVAWITLGINASAIYDVQYAATWTADGGVENPDAPNPGAQ